MGTIEQRGNSPAQSESSQTQEQQIFADQIREELFNLDDGQRKQMARLFQEYERQILEKLSEQFKISPQTLTIVLEDEGAKYGRPSGRELNLPVVEISRRYSEEEKTVTDLAEEYGVSLTTISSRLKKAGVQIKKGGSRPIGLPDEEIAEQYKQGKSLKKLGEIHGVAPQTIGQHLKKMGIELERPSKLTEEEELVIINLYQKERMNLRILGERFGVSHETIRNVLKAEDIPRRKGRPKDWLKLTEEQQREVIRLYQENETMTTTMIAENFNVSRKTVYRVIDRAGVDLHPQKRQKGVWKKDLPMEKIARRYENGAHSTTLAEEFGVTPTTIILRLRAKGVKIRPVGRRRN